MNKRAGRKPHPDRNEKCREFSQLLKNALSQQQFASVCCHSLFPLMLSSQLIAP
jgi:hypothetical protein